METNSINSNCYVSDSFFISPLYFDL